MKHQSEIVFISGLNLYETPKIVQTAITSDAAMGPTPIVAILDAKVEVLVGVVPYFHMKDVTGFDKIRTDLGTHLGAPYKPEEPKFGTERWSDLRGRSFDATYMTSTDKVVTFRLANGKLSTMAIGKLDEASQKLIAERAGE